MTIIALTCLLIVGAAATSILGRDSVPEARSVITAASVKGPVSNRESKNDKLAVATLALAAFEPSRTSGLSEPLRQAYAATTPADIATPRVAAPASAPPKPKIVAKPAPQKSYAL